MIELILFCLGVGAVLALTVWVVIKCLIAMQ